MWVCMYVYLKTTSLICFKFCTVIDSIPTGVFQLYHNPEFQKVFEKLILKCEELGNFIQKPNEMAEIQFGINDSKYIK